MATYNSGSYISTDNGKFRLECDVTVSSAGMVITPKIHITDAFKEAQTFELTYYANNTTKKTKKTAANGTTKKYKKAGTHKLTTFTIKSYSVSKPIKLKVNGKTATISGGTIKSTLAPPTPSISVEQTKPTIWTITVTGKGEEEQPVNKVYVEYTNVKNAQDGDWSSLNYDSFGYHPSSSNTKAYESVFKPEIEQNQYYRFRARASGSLTGTEKFSGWVYSDGMVSRPEETSDVAIEQSTQTITWTADLNDIDKGIVKGWYIYRSENSSDAYTQVADIAAVAGTVYYSWTDTSQATGHTYSYKVVGYNKTGESWDTSATTVALEGAPYAPDITDIQYYYDEDGSVVISVSLSSNVDTTYIERSNNGGTSWTQIAALEAPTSSYTDNAATSDSIYRVRFGNNGGNSDYSDVFQPAAQVAPNVPTILLPVYLSNVVIDNGSVLVYWQHNPLDGSPQAAAQVLIKNGSQTIMTVNINTSETSFYWDVSELSPMTAKIQVKTKGANGLWSDFASTDFNLVNEPRITITSPTGIQSSLPLTVDFTYEPSSGNLEEVQVEILDEDGDSVFTTNKSYTSNPSTDSISLMDALLESEVEYSLQVVSRESNGLTAKHITNFSVEYSQELLAGSLYPIVDSDEETGLVTVQVSRDIGDDGETPAAEINHAYLYRNANGEKVLLGEVEDGFELTDKLAPVNKEFSYELLQIYSGGSAALASIEAYNPSHYSFIYWGNGYNKVARAQWNPSQTTALGRPEKTLVRYSGRKYPVVYDSKAREEQATFTAVLEPDELDDFIAVIQSGGTGIWKSVQGRTFEASFDLDFKRVDSDYNLELYECTLKVVRVED